MNTNEMTAQQLIDKLNASAKKETNQKESSVNYELFYKGCKNGVAAKVLDFKSKNFLFAEIAKMSEKDFLNLKSDEPAKKVYRKFLQSIGKGSATNEQRIIKRNEFVADFAQLVKLTDAKR